MSTDLAQAYRDFPATERWTYMDVSARGLLPRCARDALVLHVDERMNAEVDKKGYFDMVERVRGRFARRVNAHPDEVAITKNVTEGIAAIAAAIDWQTGDNVVICPEIEHPANVYAWLNLQRRGVELRMVAPRAGRMPVEDMIEKLDGRTRVITCATVSFAPGFRTDLATLGAACRARGAMLVVDAAQSIGVLDDDVERLNVDAYAASTQKGLLGLYGMGFLYCRREWAERLQPAYLSRFGVDLGDASEADLGNFEYRLAAGARRFDLGNYNFTAALNADAALDYLAQWPQPEVERYVLELSYRLARGLLEAGLPVNGGEPGPHLAHIVTVGEMTAGGHDSTQDARMQSLYEFLTAQGVRLSIRRGVLRFSLHLYNNAADVERVLALVHEWRKRR
jgi:cysteine desulfurase / selenocysteine lyase